MDFHKSKKLGIVCFVLFLIFVLGYTCPFQKLTGLPCPGCNMTTSLYYLLHGNLKVSLYYHALLIPTMFIGLLCLYYRNNQKILTYILIFWCILMIGSYIYRMITIFPNSPMVYDTHSVLSTLVRFFLH